MIAKVKNSIHTKALDRNWVKQLPIVNNLDNRSNDPTPEIIIDKVNKTIAIHQRRSKITSKELKKINRKIKAKQEILSKLEKKILHREHNALIKSYYIETIRNARNIIKLTKIKYSSLTITEKNSKTNEILNQIYPIPPEHIRQQFLNEFLSFVRYLNNHKIYNLKTLDSLEELLSASFYHVDDQKLDIDFSQDITSFQTCNETYKEEFQKEYSSKQIRKILTNFLNKIHIDHLTKIRLEDRYLFSVQGRKINIPRGIIYDHKRMVQLTAHEILVHTLRAVRGNLNRNKKNQKLLLLSKNLTANAHIEEGLATYFEQNIFYTSSKYDILNLFQFYIRMIAVHLAIMEEPYEVFDKLDKLCQLYAVIFNKKPAYSGRLRDSIFLRVYREFRSPQKGCVNGRIAQYLYGNRKIWEYKESGRNLNQLFAGKVHFDDLEELEKLGFEIPETFLGFNDFPQENLLRLILSSFKIR